MTINPFYADIPQGWKNEIDYQHIIAYFSMRQVTSTLNNIQNNQITTDDFTFRDILFKNQLPNEDEKTYFDYLNDHYKARRMTDGTDLLRTFREECQNKKLLFWKKCANMPIPTAEQYDTRNLVRSVKNDYLLLSQVGFLGGSMLIAYFLKMYRNPIKFQIITIGFGASLGYFHGVYNYSNAIFNALPPLPDPESEKERQQIINYCFSLDSDLVSKYMLYDLNINATQNQIKN